MGGVSRSEIQEENGVRIDAMGSEETAIEEEVTTEQWIDNFINYFLEQWENIDGLGVTKYHAWENLYRKILYVILLDSLSIAARPSLLAKNQARFRNLTNLLTAWPDRSRVSAPQLKLVLEHRQLGAGVLYQRITEAVGNWPEGISVLLGCDCDPLEKDLDSMMTSPEEKRAVQDCRYDSLLYSYRNSLLHEFREPGYGMEFREDVEPVYHSLMDHPWQLAFPLEFIRRLCLIAIWDVRDLLYTEHRNPYPAYPFGSLWKSNKP
jgi:hypothetical protein